MWQKNWLFFLAYLNDKPELFQFFVQALIGLLKAFGMYQVNSVSFKSFITNFVVKI